MREVFDYIDKKRNEVVEFVQELIRIPTVNPPGENYEKTVALLEGECRKSGLETKRITIPERELKKRGVKGGSKRICLVARWRVGAKKTLHFAGHYDVVPVTANWSVAPFEGIVKDGKLYGRGSEDMKGTIASMVYAVKALKETGTIPDLNVELSFSPDEEIGGHTGLGYLVKKGKIRPDYAVSEGLFGDCVSIGNKGVLWLEIEVLGRSCHASTPYKGINSFEGMVELANMLKKHKDKISKVKTRYRTRINEDQFSTMVMGGMLKGGAKVNIVPDRSSFTIDRRLLPEEDLDETKREILDIVSEFKKKNPRYKVRIKTLMAEPPVVTDLGSPLCKAMVGCVKEVTRKPAKLAITPGATDLRFLIRKGIPSVGYNAVGLDRCHGDDEFVYVKSILDTAKVFALLMLNLR